MDRLRNRTSKRSSNPATLTTSTSGSSKSSSNKSPLNEKFFSPEASEIDSSSTGNEEGPLTIVGTSTFHFIVESIEAKEASFELFNFCNNTSFSLGVNPFEQVAEKKCNVYICYFTSALGPLVPGSFAHSVCCYLGEAFQKKVAEYVNKEYYGEVPLGACFSIESSSPHKLVVIFVKLDPTNSLFAYHGFRSALLKLIELSTSKTFASALRNSASSSSSSSSSAASSSSSSAVSSVTPRDVGSLHIPEIFRTTSKAGETPSPTSIDALVAAKSTTSDLKDSKDKTSSNSSSSNNSSSKEKASSSSSSNREKLSTSTSSTNSSSNNIKPSAAKASDREAASANTDSKAQPSLMITVPVFQADPSVSAVAAVAQMAEAFRRLKNHTSKPVDLTSLHQMYDRLRSVRPFTDTERKRIFADTVRRNELVRHGISDAKEIDWLLSWVADSAQPPMQLAASLALTQFVRADRPTMPIDVTRREVLDGLFRSQQNCLKAILDLAATGSISLHNVIEDKAVKVGEEVGKGATAVVHRATYDGQEVAYKKFIEGTDLTEFRREVSMMTLLKHPCLVNILGAGHQGMEPFIVSEYVAKGDLYTQLHGDGSKQILHSDDVILQWITDVACGMQYLHSLGIIHRDLKSLNILVSGDNHCKIIDYGTSRVKSEDTTMTGNIGTLIWMAPEMFQGGAYSEKIDVYSYAIVLFELLTSDMPYKGENSFSLPVQVAHGVRPAIPKTLAKPWGKLLASCWHEKPARRPAFDKILQTIDTLKTDKIAFYPKGR